MNLRLLHIDLTGLCNLSCEYCYYADFNKPTYDGLSLSEIETVVREAEALGCKKIIFSGGEPFIRNDILEVLSIPKVTTAAFSNGTLLSEKVVRGLSQIGNLEEIRVSFDGFQGHNKNRKPSSWQEVASVFSRLRDYGIGCSINTILTKNNLHELIDIYDFLGKQHITRWRMQAPFPYGRFTETRQTIGLDLDELYQRLSELIKKYLAHPSFLIEIFGAFDLQILKSGFFCFDGTSNPCAYNFDGATIRVDGNVDICASLFHSIGNIKTQSLREIINGPKRKKFEAIRVADIEDCGTCKYMRFCGAGCRALALYRKGNIMAKDEYACEVVGMFKKHILPLMPKYVNDRFCQLCD